MTLIEFKEQTTVIAKEQPEYAPLPAHRFPNDPQGRIAFCWKGSLWDRIKFLFTGKLWHQVLTFNYPVQPQMLALEKPDMPAYVARINPISMEMKLKDNGWGVMSCEVEMSDGTIRTGIVEGDEHTVSVETLELDPV